MEDGRLTGLDVPMLGVVPTADEDRIVGHLGPDLCGPVPPDLDEVTDRLRREPDEPLAAALLDQRNVAGFGNLYAVELPFIVGVSPNQPVGGVGALEALRRHRHRRHPHERRPRAAEHDRPAVPRRRPLDLRPARPAMPAVRRPARRLGRARQPVAARHDVVPGVPAAGAGAGPSTSSGPAGCWPSTRPAESRRSPPAVATLEPLGTRVSIPRLLRGRSRSGTGAPVVAARWRRSRRPCAEGRGG